MNTSFRLSTPMVEINNNVFELTLYAIEEDAKVRSQLKVRDQKEKEIPFQMNKAASPSKLKKVFSKLAKVEAVRFLFDGQRICNEGTSKSSEWEDMIKSLVQKTRV